MNFFQKLIRFLVSLFGGMKAEQQQKPAVKPAPRPDTEPAVPPPATGGSPPSIQPKPGLTPIPLDEKVRSRTLHLGCYDEDVTDEQVKALIDRFHAHMGPNKPSGLKMRHNDSLSWVDARPVKGNSVRALQTFLINAGLMPPTSKADGIFSYFTLAGVRLFQEYERIHGNHPAWVPDGVVGPNTWSTMLSWQDHGKKADKWTRGMETAEYTRWMNLLRRAKTHYVQSPHAILTEVNSRIELLKAKNVQTDTLATTDWSFNTDDTHLIGIRRKEDSSSAGRKNDDIFILLINGMAFTFFGSTDPNLKYSRRSDEPFLVEGQHKFRFGWHHKSSPGKMYQGLNPYSSGVLVVRDQNNDNQLTDADIEKGLDPNPNNTIYIHWTGHGKGASGTWSAGCQVIAGMGYEDNLGEERDCSAFAAVSPGTLENNSVKRIGKSMGAYNVFTDLVLCYAAKPVDYILYTLGRDETLSREALVELGGQQALAEAVDTFNLPRSLG